MEQTSETETMNGWRQIIRAKSCSSMITKFNFFLQFFSKLFVFRFKKLDSRRKKKKISITVMMISPAIIFREMDFKNLTGPNGVLQIQ